MIGRCSALLAAARTVRTWRIVIPAAALAVALGFAVPAAARAHQRPPAHRSVTLRTLVNHVNVHSGPSLNSRVVGRVWKRGTKVAVNCFATGGRVAGNPVWYHVAKPRSGYITSYYTDTHYDPVAGLGSCAVRSFSRTYHVLLPGVHIRSAPTAFLSIVRTLDRVGTKVTVNCWVAGEDISGDAIWYHTIAPDRGYVAGEHLDTGHDPAYGVPRCR
jgi:Bacterial SH3 domain